MWQDFFRIRYSQVQYQYALCRNKYILNFDNFQLPSKVVALILLPLALPESSHLPTLFRCLISSDFKMLIHLMGEKMVFSFNLPVSGN